MPALDLDSESSPPVLSERARGKRRALSPRSPSLPAAAPSPRSPRHSPSPRKRSRSASSSHPRPPKRARSVIDLDEEDSDGVDDGVMAAARDGDLDDLLDGVDPDVLQHVLERTTADAARNGSRVGSDAGDPIELSDDSDDEPVVVRPPAAPVPAAPAPAAPSSEHPAGGPQPFAALTCRASSRRASHLNGRSDLPRRARSSRRHQCVTRSRRRADRAVCGHACQSMPFRQR